MLSNGSTGIFDIPSLSAPSINDNQCRTFLFARFICCYEDITERSKQFNVHTAAAAAQKNTIKRQQKMSI